MKKKFIIYLILAMCFQKAVSQVFEPETTLGAKFGYNISRVNFDSIVYQNLKYGFNGGLVFRYMAEKYAGIQLELIVTQKGWDEKLEAPSKYHRTLTYLELPFLAHFEVGGKTSKFQVNIGSYFSYFIFQERKMEINPPDIVQPYYAESIDNSMDFGLCGGLGFLQKTSIGHFEVEARFSQGLGNIFKYGHYTKIRSSSLNQLLSIDLSYLINL